MTDYPPDAVCAEQGCTEPVTTERFTGMIGENVVVELVCERHVGEGSR